MDCGEDAVLVSRPVIDTSIDSAPAAKPSPDSTEAPNGRRRSERRIKTAATPGDVPPYTGFSARLLRARGAGGDRTTESTNAISKIERASLPRGRGRDAGSRARNTPVTQTAIKKHAASKGPKLSRSRKGKGRSPKRTTPASTCKPEAETEAPSCGVDTDPEKGSKANIEDPDVALDEDPPLRDNQNGLICKPDTKTEKSRRRTKLQQKDVKEEAEENDVKKEEQGEGDDIVPTRKRGRRDEKGLRQPKRRKKPPVQYVRCEMEGCDTVLAHPRYLQHHIKYQHLLKKKYVCDHPSCGRLFRLQKQLLRHAKHHTDQRDYICEYCARAFKSAHNLAVHRMIHTGEKPIQCEICGFTCRQKASLNWHMKKHDAEASYQFSCSICGKKFEKKDSVVAHKAKSHPEVLIAEALAANGGSLISCPIPVPLAVTQPEQTSVIQESQASQESQESQEAVGSTLTPLQQVVLPLAPQSQLDIPQNQFLQLPTHHVVQVTQQQQTPALLHLTSPSHPQLIQLSTLPPMASTDSSSTLLTLSSVTTLASTGSIAPQTQVAHWGREDNRDAHIPGEGELWDRVVVGDGRQDVGEMMWEGNRERRKETEGIVWEREEETQILLQCAEVHADGEIKIEEPKMN
ncbi:E3 ubiquitin-protein ligase ZFP91-like isoform X2 [Parambassis ranga]|uniref:E3 ubiquitin-protein ligase ZFP91 n=1 Tax=Parambassis ranga TaxID=210632 RepID=A0A6P7K9D3_9TELE|nr:E3 ubiquitin-protein ligase ZFP91-like isoform X2 [Parambassis ranga]